MFLIDTNVAIGLVANRLPVYGRDLVDELIVNNRAATSVINRIELLGFHGPESELAVLERLLQVIPVLGLSEEVVLRSIDLHKRHRIKFPDAMIAATALAHDLILISCNSKSFKRVAGLEYLDPHDFCLPNQQSHHGPD